MLVLVFQMPNKHGADKENKYNEVPECFKSLTKLFAVSMLLSFFITIFLNICEGLTRKKNEWGGGSSHNSCGIVYFDMLGMDGSLWKS